MIRSSRGCRQKGGILGGENRAGWLYFSVCWAAFEAVAVVCAAASGWWWLPLSSQRAAQWGDCRCGECEAAAEREGSSTEYTEGSDNHKR